MSPRSTGVVLLLLLAFVALVAARFGAVTTDLACIRSAVVKQFMQPAGMNLQERIFIDIRLPRVLLCLITGAALAAGGVLLQALFRNPLVEPGLIGTSSGAAFGASLCLVLGASFQFDGGGWLLPSAACAGALVATFLVTALSTRRTQVRSSALVLLLMGVAINAIFMSGVGFLSYIARDPQARSITFWNLGTLSGAGWQPVCITGITTGLCIALALRDARQLNTLIMGEEEALHLGVNIEELKRRVLFLNVTMVAVCTAFVGIISFVGLIVPHVLRMLHGSDNRPLLRNSALLGAVLLCLADLVARTALMPAELPIGIVTSVVGVPVFILLIRRKNYFF